MESKRVQQLGANTQVRGKEVKDAMNIEVMKSIE